MTRPLRKESPLLSFLNSAFVDLPAPSNLSYFWGFGSLLGLCLVSQMATGVLLAMHFCPEEALAFSSVVLLTQESYVLRLWHSNGTSVFFLLVFLHIGRGLYFASYLKRAVWNLGVFLFVVMMATSFIGYVLPWGQMSFWAATVITNLLSAVPYVGGDVVRWVWGGFGVSGVTLNRFFSLHYLLPFLLAALSILHILALHAYGSGNPLGLRAAVDKVPFFPYFVLKDLLGFSLFFLFLSSLVFFVPFFLGDPENFKQANPLVTPVHIQPEWYLLSAYAILRSIPNKVVGVFALVASFAVLFLMPYLHFSRLQALVFRPLSRVLFFLFIGDFLLLTWVGGLPVEFPYVAVGQASAAFYFSYFLVLNPLAGFLERQRPS